MRTKIVALAAALLPSVVLANGYDVPNITPRDLALVESAIAAQDDAGAVYANPAALSKVRGLSLNLAGSFLDLKTSWSAPADSSMAGAPGASTKFKPVPPVSLFAAYGLDVGGHGVGFGLGMNVPGGGNVFWQDDWAGRGRIITVDRKVYGFYLTGGAEVLPGLRAGGGLVYYYTTEYLKIGIQPFQSAYGELATKGGAPAYDLSFEYTPQVGSRPLTVGLDYKHKATQNLTGDGNFVVPDSMLTTSPPPVDQGVSHQLTYPNVLNVGVAYRPASGVQLTGVFTLSRYKVYGSDTFNGDQGTVIHVPRNYDNGKTFRIGAEYDVSRRVTVRAGILRDLSGLRTDTYSPTLPDGNAWAGAVGAAWKITPDLSLAGTVFYALLDRVTTSGTIVMPGNYDTNVTIVSAGLTWRTDLATAR